MQNQNISTQIIIALIFVMGFLVWKEGPALVQNVSGLKRNLEGEWYAKFYFDDQIRNLSQTEWIKLEFGRDGVCHFAFADKEIIKTLAVSDDQKSRDIGSGHTRRESSFQGRYRLAANWQRVDLILTFPGRTYFSNSFEPFVVSQKPAEDFTDPKSQVEVKATVSFSGNNLVLAANNKEITLARPAEDYINLIPLVRSGAASGDARMRVSDRIRKREEGEIVRRYSSGRPVRALQPYSNRILPEAERTQSIPASTP